MLKCRRHACLLGDVGERAVAIVPVEMVVRRRRGGLPQRIGMHSLLERDAADHIEIRQAVVVVIEPDGAAAGAFEQRPEFLAPKLWVKWMPDFSVTSSKRMGGLPCSAATGREQRQGQQQLASTSFHASVSGVNGQIQIYRSRGAEQNRGSLRSPARVQGPHGSPRTRAARRGAPRTSPSPPGRLSHPCPATQNGSPARSVQL